MKKSTQSLKQLHTNKQAERELLAKQTVEEIVLKKADEIQAMINECDKNGLFAVYKKTLKKVVKTNKKC